MESQQDKTKDLLDLMGKIGKLYTTRVLEAQKAAVGSQYGEQKARVFYYFSVTTLTTAGFGDITAVNPFARTLVMMEALIGQLYTAILIARLVSLHVETKREKKGEHQ